MAASSIQASRGRPGVKYFRPGVTAVTNCTRRLCVLLPGLGGAVIEWKFGRVESHIYISQFRGSAPSLKASSLKASLRIPPPIFLRVDPPTTSI